MRDIVGELTEAVREENIRMGLYYSGIIDWQYANDPIVNEEDEIYNSCPTAEYADYAYKQCCELIDTIILLCCGMILDGLTRRI